MNTYVRAMYDFAGQPDSSEISIKVGDIITLTRTDIGEGWWEGRTSEGQVGLFPASYVEAIAAAEATGPRKQQTGVTQQQQPGVMQRQQSTVMQQQPTVYEEDSDSDDGWDSDSVNSKVGTPTETSTPTERESSASGTLPAGTLKRTSKFGKGSDSYILGGVAIRERLPDSELVQIVQRDNFYHWQSNRPPYSVVVGKARKQSKLKGMKTYIVYDVTPSFNNVAVPRRYKHFDWLYRVLVKKFCLVAVPPVPEKQVAGRYEEQFLEHRRHLFQEFVDWMARHPVLAHCQVWHHFLTSRDNEKAWKAGKRRAEDDPYFGLSYCLAITAPDKHLLASQVDAQLESCSQFVPAMDAAVRSLFALAGEAAKRNQVQCRKEFQRIGDGFADLAKALNIDEQRAPPAAGAKPLSTNVARLGSVFIDIGKIHETEAKTDWTTLSDRLYIYRGVLNQFPSILSTHKDALQKRKECERMIGERGNNVQMVDVNRRTDVVSYAVMAEMSHFKQQRETHLRQSMKSFLEEQIQFYSHVVAKLQEAHRYFE